jgi:hypothetical protein
MAVTQAQIDALNQAIADGVRQVTIGGQTVTYNTTDSLIRARDDLLRQLRAQEAAAVEKRENRRTLLHYAGRGY